MAAATASVNGYMTSTYAGKLDGIAAGATANAKATGAEIDTGTDDVKFATPKAIADSRLVFGPSGVDATRDSKLVAFDGNTGKLLKSSAIVLGNVVQ